jgi:tetratricopeptide (TPR) repeat protein
MLDLRRTLEEGLRYHKLGMLDEALEHYRVAIDAASDPEVVSEGYCREAHTYRASCRWDDAINSARRSATVAREAHLDEQYAQALNAEAIVHQERGAYDAAMTLFEIIVGMTVSDRLSGITFVNMGAIAAQRADLDTARHYFRESHRCFARAGYPWGEAFALTNQSAVALDAGRLKEAEVIAGHAVVAAKKVGDLELLGAAMLNLAEAIAPQRRLDQAESLALDALRYFEIEENDLRRAQCYRVLADIKVLQGWRPDAQRLYSQAIGLACSVGADREVTRIRDAMELLGAPA